MKKQQNKLAPNSQKHVQINTQLNQYSASYEGLVQLQSSINTLNTQENKLNQGIAIFNTQINNAREKIKKGRTQLMQNEKKLNYGYSEYNKNLSTFNTKM
ncbi:hypothetical protein, partial [Clostridium tyrobutyricum]